MLPHPLTNFETQKYYQNEPRFNGVFSRNNLPLKIKDGAYVINLDEYADVGTHWIALFCNRNEIVYFDSFGVEHVPEEINEFVGNKNIIVNIFRVQANNSVMCGYFCIGFIDFMLTGKNWLILQTCFLRMTLRKLVILFRVISKMNERNSIQTIDRTNLTEQTKIKLNKITEIENYFHEEINQSKYIAAFDYIDKVLIALSATSGGISIILFTSIVGDPVPIVSASFTLIFSLKTGIVKKLLSITRNKKNKHDKIFMLAKSKLNSIETLISQALIDMEISHEEFVAIFKGKDKYEKMKENLRGENEKREIITPSSVKLKR